MELVERYLSAIKPHLPKAQRADILAELSENLSMQLEEKEENLGRTLTEVELQAMLSQFGHPLLVAGRYSQQDNRTFTFGRVLIGTELFPFYIRALQWSLGIATLAVCIVISALAWNQPAKWDDLLPTLQFQIMLQFAIQTAVWALIQAHSNAYPESWALALGEKPVAAKSKPDTISRFDSIVQIVVWGLCLPWIHAVLWRQHIKFGHGELAPIWHEIYIPVMCVVTGTIGQSVVNFVRPHWIRFYDVSQIVFSLASAAILGYLLNAGEWVVLTDKTGDIAKRITETASLNHYLFFYPLLVTFISVAIYSLFTIRTLIRRKGVVSQ